MAKVMIAAFFASLLFFTQSAAAIEIDGSDDPKFEKAVEAWLNDDDPGSLPILSKLAMEGNNAAQYLLGQIERTTHFSAETPYTRTMDRKQRIALFRSPGGLAGTSWVSVLKDDNEELATVLISLKDPQYDKEQLAALIRMGEKQTAMKELIRRMGMGEYSTIIDLYENNQLDAGNRAYGWYSYLLDKNKTKSKSAAMLKNFNNDFNKSGIDSALMARWAYRYLNPKTDKLKKMDRYGQALNGPSLMYQRKKWAAAEITAFQDWLANNASSTENLTLPYIFCRQECPESIGKCMTGVLAMTNGYENLRTFQSPLENLIPNNEYLVSERAKSSLFRRMKWQRTQWDLNKRYGISNCLANTLTRN
jgi:hypothetical protein